MTSRRKPRTKYGRHRSTHPWEFWWTGASGNGRVLPDRERFGLGDGVGCRTLADMTPEEIAAIEREYGAKVIPR